MANVKSGNTKSQVSRHVVRCTAVGLLSLEQAVFFSVCSGKRIGQEDVGAEL